MSPRSVRRIAGLLGVVTAALAGSWVAERVYVRSVPPAAGEAESGEAEGFAVAARQFSGSVVWSSNRTGNHEIYRLDLRGGRATLRALTHDPHVDTFPRFSPDGSKILFNRSREPWVSFRNQEPWDVWIMDADGGNPRRIAEVGFHPGFAPDGKSIVFSRRGKVMRQDLADGREQLLVDTAGELDGLAQEPELYGDALAMTIRGRGRRAFGVYDLRARRFRELPGDSCQIGWWPGGERLVWVEAKGNGGNRLRWARAGGGAAATLIDLPGRRSHEYFPRASRDGRWLVWGATATGHEHDRADYEVFLWKVGEPWSQAMRLTRHSGNDQWPDVRPDR